MVGSGRCKAQSATHCGGVQVTDENKAEYVQLLANFKMTESVKPFIKAFCEGLWSCLSIDSLRVFSPEQLGLLISGRPDISIKEMHACVKYEGFTADDATIRWFWELVREMHQQDVAKLLAFMTGASRRAVYVLQSQVVSRGARHGGLDGASGRVQGRRGCPRRDSRRCGRRCSSAARARCACRRRTRARTSSCWRSTATRPRCGSTCRRR